MLSQRVSSATERARVEPLEKQSCCQKVRCFVERSAPQLARAAECVRVSLLRAHRCALSHSCVGRPPTHRLRHCLVVRSNAKPRKKNEHGHTAASTSAAKPTTSKAPFRLLELLPPPLLALVASQLPVVTLLRLQRCYSSLRRLCTSGSYMAAAWRWAVVSLPLHERLHRWTVSFAVELCPSLKACCSLKNSVANTSASCTAASNVRAGVPRHGLSVAESAVRTRPSA